MYINASDNSSSSMIHADTHINSGGGLLYMGPDEGGWLTAGGSDNDSSYVNILKDGGSLFTVGETDANRAMIYAEFGDSSGTDSSMVSLHGKRFQVFADNHGMSSGVSVGGVGNGLTGVDGFTAITTKYTDILGSTYLGSREMTDPSENNGDGIYSRGGWTLGVAGSAWVDQTLWARKAWFRDAGMANLHAGYKNMADFTAHPKTAWLNVYGESSGVGSGRVVIRDPNKITSENQDSYGDGLDVMFLASSGVAVLSDTEGAWVQLDHETTHVGSMYNYFGSDNSDSTGVSGSSYVVGGKGVDMYTYDSSDSSKVDIQKGALELYGHNIAGVENKIIANASKFGIKTGSTSVEDITDSQFYADADVVRTRYVNFEVQKDNDSSVVFGVYPNDGADDSANVEIKGSLHVTGNKVIHIASDADNTAKEDSSRAMFEIDPDYVRVLAKDAAGQFIDNGEDNFALLTIASHDTHGSTLVDEMADTSIYIRRGAIELEKSNSSVVGLVDADAGYGYIKANRFVSNVDAEVPDVGGTAANTRYDKYMVNPAYTSVMHDIKLTTRGNARLSDILPDYVLKGVYNVSNDYKEGSKEDRVGINEHEWADPYLGNIYFPMCPTGYVGLATVVPISFQMGKAGHAVPVAGGSTSVHTWQIVEGKKHADILRKAKSLENRLVYPGLEEVKSLNWNAIYQSSDTFSQFVATNDFKVEGWFWGLSSELDDYGSSRAEISWDGNNVGTYKNMGDSTYAVAEPLYFQDGTFLKTSLLPKSTDGLWEARMGFIYDTGVWGGLGGYDGNTICSNNTQGGGGNASSCAAVSGYVWNLFPVMTNTLEGHATVYCYFKRSAFDPQHVLQYNPEADNYSNDDKESISSGTQYIQRLNDPSLKYNEIW